MKTLLVSAVVLVIGVGSGFAAGPDTPETRRQEAERYLKAVPPTSLFEDMAEKMSANLPPDQRAQFKTMMTSDLDISALTKAMSDAMVKHFTTEELKALADFYASPLGELGAEKLGAYIGGFMPTKEGG